MKKIGLLLLVLVLAMGALGVGYAHWTGELNVNGTVNVGTFGAELTQDNGVITDAIDDEMIGDETCTLYALYAAWADAGKTQDNGHATCTVADKKTDISGCADDTMTITLTDAYPCYKVWVPVDVHCLGTVPIKVWYEFGVNNPAADVCEVSLIADPALSGTDVSLVPADSEANAIKLHQCETARALIYIHPVQPDEGPPSVPGAEPGVTYNFTITIHYVQAQ
jgi:hypothetical protein